MLIKLWSDGDLIPDIGPLYFRADDAQSLQNALLANDHKNFPSLVKVVPNGETQLGIIHSYLIAKKSNDTKFIYEESFGEYEYPTKTILIFCYEIISGLNDFSSERILSACTKFEDFTNALPQSPIKNFALKLLKAIECIGDLTKECLYSLEHGSPFLHSQLHVSCKDWWNQSPDIAKRIISLKSNIPRKFGTSAFPKGLSQLELWMNDIESRVNKLISGTHQTASRNSAIIEASAYCAALAERYLSKSCYALAILLLHRSADLFMMQVCSTKIDFTRAGGEYQATARPGKDTRISLLSSIDISDIYHLLPPSHNRNHAFVQLNSWRNLLIQTHYMSDISKTTATTIFTQARPELEKIANKDWKTARFQYKQGISLKLDELLNVDNILTSYFNEVDIDSMV